MACLDVFATSPGDEQDRTRPSSLLFVSAVLPEHNTASPPTPLHQPLFFAGPVCGLVPTQIETCQCGLLSSLTRARAPVGSQADKKAECEMLAQAALFAHACRWSARHHGNHRAVARQYVEKNGDSKLANWGRSVKLVPLHQSCIKSAAFSVSPLNLNCSQFELLTGSVRVLLTSLLFFKHLYNFVFLERLLR